MIQQPRTPTGNFGSNGATPHEKHRFHSHAAHICRVNATIARYNGETSKAETHDTVAATHDRLAASHLVAALKT